VENDRYERGLEVLRQVNPNGLRVIESLAAIAPDLGRWIVEFGYGEVYGRKGLPLRDRQIATIATLATQGGVEPQLAYHIEAGLNAGLEPREVVDVLVHLMPFVGFPRALNAVNTAKKLFQARGLEV
jgi:4-carboxymuconolactone decarboxylase